MSSTRDASKSRRTRRTAGQHTEIERINATVSGSANVLGANNMAMHIAGNVYVCLHASHVQLSDAERQIVEHYRAASTRARNAIRSVAALAASTKRGG